MRIVDMQRWTGRAVVAALVMTLVALLPGCQTPEKHESTTTSPEQDARQVQGEADTPRQDEAEAATSSTSEDRPAAAETDDEDLERLRAAQAEGNDALRELIMELARERGIDLKPKRDAKPKPRPASTPRASENLKKPTSAARVADRPATAAKERDAKEARTDGATNQESQAKPKKSGCGSAGPGLSPPPPDQPQPKFVCANEKIVLDAVWKGERAAFVWEVKNEGAGPLEVQVRKR